MASDYERLLDSQKLQGNVAKLLGVEDEKNLANDVARNWARENRLEDNAEDTLRHILLGGLLQNVPKTQGLYGEHGEDILGRMGKGIARQFIDRGPFGLGREGTDKESLIDIANNNFGGELRVQYPSTESFIRAAKEAVSDLIKNKKVKGIKGISPRLSTVGGQKNKFQEGGNVMAEDKNTQGALAGIAEENEENLAWLKRVNDKSILNEIYDVVVKKFKELGGSQEQPTYGPITYTPVQPETATPTSVSTRDFATESPQPVRSGIVDTSLRGPVKEPETLGPPKRGFVSPTVSSVQTTPYYQDVPPSVQTTEHTGGDARLAESLYQSPKPRKPDRGPYEMGTKDYGRRKSLRNQTPEQKIANEVDQLRSANLISDTSQDMSGVASAIKTAMSQHEVNPDFTNSDTARAYQILQELPTNVQTGPATLSSLIENPTDEENRNFMKKHAPVLYQAFPALRAIYDRDIQSATPANIQDLADVVGLDNLPPAMQERILTKREAIEYEVTPQAKEKKWVDDFHDTEGLAARGGLIGYQMGAEVQTNPMRMGSEDTGSAGFIGTTKEGREDRAMALQNGDMGTDGVDATVDEGSFVLNSWAVALAGRQYIEELVKKAKQYIASPEGRAQLGNRELQPEEIDIRVSNGEYVFPPAMVEIIGRERLEKMNNRGIQAFEEEQRGRPEAMAMQESEGLVPRPDQIPQNPAQEGDFDELEAMSQQQIGAHRGGTIGGTKGIMRDLKELFYGPEPDMLLVMGEKSDEKNKPSKRTGGFVSDNGSKKNYAEENLVDDNENFQTAFMNPIPYYTTKILPKIKETESDRFPPYKVPQETEEDYQRYLLEEQGEETGFVNPPIPSTKPIKPTESTKLPEKPNLSVLPYNQKISHNLGSLTIFEAWRDFYNISKPKEENTEKFNKWLKKLETFKENTKTKYGFAQQDTEMRHAAKIAGEIFDGDYGFGKKDIAEFLYVIGLHESLGGEVKVERQKKDVDAKRARGLFQVNPSTARSLIGTPNGYIGKKALNQILKEMGVEKKFENTKEAREYVKKYIRKDKSTFPISENFEKFLQNDVINAILAAAQLITQVTDTMQKSQYYADGGTVSSDDDDYLDHINNWFEGGKDWFKSGKEVTGGLRDSIGEIQDKMNKYGVGYTSKEGLSYRTPLLGGKLKFNLNPRKKSGGIEFKIPFST